MMLSSSGNGSMLPFQGGDHSVPRSQSIIAPLEYRRSGILINGLPPYRLFLFRLSGGKFSSFLLVSVLGIWFSDLSMCVGADESKRTKSETLSGKIEFAEVRPVCPIASPNARQPKQTPIWSERQGGIYFLGYENKRRNKSETKRRNTESMCTDHTASARWKPHSGKRMG